MVMPSLIPTVSNKKNIKLILNLVFLPYISRTNRATKKSSYIYLKIRNTPWLKINRTL